MLKNILKYLVIYIYIFAPIINIKYLYNMKKLIIMLLAVVTIGIGVQAAPISFPVPSSDYVSRGVTFRSTQKLRSSDGFEMYLYTDHSIKMFDDEGQSVGSGTWQISGDELYFYTNRGRLIGKYQCKVANGELKWVKFNGDTYYKK